MPVRGVQLDSWWYPHQVLRPFDTEEWVVPPTGLVRWEPRDDVVPDGIPALRRELGDPPLVTHIRHLSASSPYVETFDCWVDGEQAHPSGADYYETLLDQAASWGVEVFEHDWLVECFLGVRGLREAPGRARAWQEGLDRAAGQRGMTLQWCMPTPADLMQTATLRNVSVDPDERRPRLPRRPRDPVVVVLLRERARSGAGAVAVQGRVPHRPRTAATSR